MTRVEYDAAAVRAVADPLQNRALANELSRLATQIHVNMKRDSDETN